VVLQQEIPIEQNLRLAQRAQHLNTPVLFNLAPATHVPNALLNHVDWLVVNEVEAAFLASSPQQEDITHIAEQLADSNHFNVVVTQGKHNDTLKKIAASRETKLTIANTDDIEDGFMEKFSHLEHKENVATALEVCKQVGVEEGSALEGMLKVQPDPGALFIKKIQFGDNYNFFVNAFAANDPLSTLNILELIKKQIPLHPTCVFLNTRADRRSRTNQMITLVSETIQPDIFLIRGDKLPEIPEGLFKLTIFPYRSKPEDIIEHLSTLTNHVIFGIGNMVGWGEQFVKKLKDFQSDD
jgi:poly-gamma-glutamate synthase PgsB/CapB